MTDIDLPDLIELRHPDSWGSVAIAASPDGIVASHHAETIDDAIGLVAAALVALLERRAEAVQTVHQWLPESIRG